MLAGTVKGWSQVAATDQGRDFVQKGSRILVDVFARADHFPRGWLKLAVALQSQQTEFDQQPFQEVRFDQWQTLVFEYDKRRHKRSLWTVVKILSMTDDNGVLLIDNVRIEK